MSTEQKIQEWVHRIEEGRWVKWVQLTALLALMLAMFGAFILDPWFWGLYRGLNHPRAMEQAQIAREMARGNGFSTKMIRPLAYAQFRSSMGAMPIHRIPDTYHAPLWPAVVAPFLKVYQSWPDSLIPYRPPAKDRLQMSSRQYIYVGDRLISAVALIFFYLAIMVNYFTVRRLFDNFMGIWTVILMLGCGLFWQFSISGLPQMLMLFLFSCVLYALVRAIEQRFRREWPWNWLVWIAVLFGLLALTHGITIWIFVGALLFCSFYFRPRLHTFLLMSVIFLAVYSPWLYRNYRVCHNPFGISAYGALEGIRGTEKAIMRGANLEMGGISPGVFRRKVQSHVSDDIGNLFDCFGRVVAAPVFFLTLLYAFKSRLPRALRWALLSMWAFGVLGMAVFGTSNEGVGLSANDLHILFIPLFSAYGMAFILVMWTRLENPINIIKYALFGLIFAVSSLPLVNLLTMPVKSPFQWPPYVPPSIAILREWTAPQEIIASDMPWAVAWYADRKSIWIPLSIQSFLDLNDYERIGTKIAGVYLTPVSGNQPLISDIVKGDYKEWAPFILRNINVKDFPLRYLTPMPPDNQCIFYSDRDRWTERSE